MNSFQGSTASLTARPTTVLLIRHAETDAMRTKLTGRLPHVDLSAAGARQATALAQRLSTMRLATVYSSPLLRARTTAGAIAAHLNVDVEIDTDLIEIDFGEWTGLTFDELSQRDEWRAYNADRARARIPGGEPPIESAARVARALHRFHARHPGAAIAAVTHAELIRYAVLAARKLPLARWTDVEIPPASVSILDCGTAQIRERPHLLGTSQ
jgi:broad specificity phosphatase PhoE